MASYRNNKPNLWADILALANHDDSLVRVAALEATDTQGRVHLKAIKRHILNTTNPALLATLDAACEFTRQVNCDSRLVDLPHLDMVYEMATRDNAAPRRIFNEAASVYKGTRDINVAMRAAISAQSMHPPFH